jgi:hypothetical protein
MHPPRPLGNVSAKHRRLAADRRLAALRQERRDDQGRIKTDSRTVMK